MANSRPRKKAKAYRDSSRPKTNWKALQPRVDQAGKEIKRFYKLETLASAADYALGNNDRVIVPSVQTVLGPTAIASLNYELMREGRHKLVFRVQATTIKKNSATFALVVAKNDKESSLVVTAEWENLKRLHARVPDAVQNPLKIGHFYLPDRYRRVEHGREIVCYMTHWAPDFEPVVLDERYRLVALTEPRYVFSQAECESFRELLVDAVVRSYDPEDNTAAAIPDVPRAHCLVRRMGRGRLRLQLVGCRLFRKHVTPVKLIDRIFDAGWPRQNRQFKVIPSDPDEFYTTLAKALGKETALRWLGEYLAAVAAGKVAPRKPEYLEALKQIVASKAL